VTRVARAYRQAASRALENALLSDPGVRWALDPDLAELEARSDAGRSQRALGAPGLTRRAQ